MVLSLRSEDVCQLSLPETQCGCCCIKDDRNGAADMAKKPRTSNGDLDDIEADHPASNFHRSHQNQAPHGRAPGDLPRQCQNCRAKLRPALQQETAMDVAMLWRSALLRSNEATLSTPTTTEMMKLVCTKAEIADSATFGCFSCTRAILKEVLQRHGAMELQIITMSP